MRILQSILLACVFGACSFVPYARAEAPRGFPGGHRDALGDRYNAQAHAIRANQARWPQGEKSAIRRWNRIALDASGIDHTPLASGETRVFGEQLGPARSSRAMAIVHIAMFDAVNAISYRYRSYAGHFAAAPDTSMDAAVAQAARDALVALFPSQKAQFDALLDEDLHAIHNARGKAHGIDLGKRAAAAILERRSDDGSNHAEPVMGVNFITRGDPGEWRQDPVSLSPIALGARWAEVRPFVIPAAETFRTEPPPALDSEAYANAYNETQTVGGDGVVTPTARTEKQTEIGIFWAYDGTPSLCAPPRLYNQIAVQIADQMRTKEVELARLLALINTAMADTAIAVWDSKYHYRFWRPVTGIRESDVGTGPTGLGDGNADTVGDPNFTPLGAPASNLNGPNFTPPFPAYPSGHAGFGGALFQTLRLFFRRDDIRFTFVSDEFNAVTVDNEGNVRPLRSHTFDSLSEAEEENGQSRMYLGIHWAFDKTAGIAQGRQVANHIFENSFQPHH